MLKWAEFITFRRASFNPRNVSYENFKYNIDILANKYRHQTNPDFRAVTFLKWF